MTYWVSLSWGANERRVSECNMMCRWIERLKNVAELLLTHLLHSLSMQIASLSFYLHQTNKDEILYSPLFQVHLFPHPAVLEIISLSQMSCVWCVLEMSWLLCGSCEKQTCGTDGLRRVMHMPCSTPSCRPAHVRRPSGPSRSCVKSWSCIPSVSRSSTTPWGADCTTGRPKHCGPNWTKEPARKSTWEATLAPAPRYKHRVTRNALQERVLFTSVSKGDLHVRFVVCSVSDHRCRSVWTADGYRAGISGCQGGSCGKAWCFLTEQCSTSLALHHSGPPWFGGQKVLWKVLCWSNRPYQWVNMRSKLNQNLIYFNSFLLS